MLKTEFNPKKETRISLWKSVKEISIPTGEVWRIPDKDAHALINELFKERSDKLKKVTFIKTNDSLEVFVNRYWEVFDLEKNRIGQLQDYRTTKTIMKKNWLDEEYKDFVWATYLQDENGNPYQATHTTLHEIKELYIKNTKLIYRTATISATPIVNGCIHSIKKRTYITMDFSNNAFYITEYLNNKKTIKRIPLHWIDTRKHIPWELLKIDSIKRIVDHMAGVENFDFTLIKANEYYKKQYKNKNINFPDFKWGFDDENYKIINKAIKKVLSWKNPTKHISKKTKGYGKKIRKIIFTDPWKLEMFEILKTYIKNLDTIQKYMMHEKCADIYIQITKYHEEFEKINEYITTDIKSLIFVKILEHITDPVHLYSSFTIWDTIEHITAITKTAKTKNININTLIKKLNKAISGTLNETDTNLARLAYELKNEKTVYKYDNQTSPYKYINNTNWEMRIPKDSTELYDWGNAFHNCVSSYSDKIQNRQCNIITFWDDDKPISCVEIEPNFKIIRQALEPCNKNPNEDIKNQFIKGFMKLNNLTYPSGNGIIMPDVFA